MKDPSQLQDLLSKLDTKAIKLGDIKKLAKAIKRDHELALELWASQQLYPRMIAVLIMDKRQLTQDVIDSLIDDLNIHELEDKLQLADWFLANQLMKDKKTVALLGEWEDARSSILRRLFWYHQARLRWTGQRPPNNTEALLDSLESNLGKEEPEVQWAMNFTAGQIGIHEPKYRSRCILLGEKLGLYKDDPISKGCTPNYLPEFIRIEVEKRQTK